MLRPSIILGGLLLTFFSGGCSSIATKVSFDRETDFSSYRTFYVGSLQTENHRAIRLEVRDQDKIMLCKEVGNQVATYLEELGYRRTVRASADFMVVCHVNVSQKVAVDKHGYGYRHRWRTLEVQRYREGTILVDLVDQRDRELFWRGVATGAMGQNRKAAQAKVALAVEKIMSEFPPELFMTQQVARAEAP